MTTAAASALNLNETPFTGANIHRSVASGQLTLVQRLIANGCDPNLPHATTGLRPIHFAASRGHVDLVEYLVETSQCQVDATDKEGETALLKAAYAGHLAVVMYLVNKANANYLRQDRDGWTALHNACSFGSLSIIEFLLNQPLINVNIASKKGHTPLMNAASKGHVNIVTSLLEKYHANPILKNKFGETAYDVAAAAGEAYLCQVLETCEMRYGLLPLDFHVTIPVVLLEVVADNSSYINLFGKPVTKWYHRDQVIPSRSKVALPNTSWFWLSDWTIDFTFPDLSYDGWSTGQNSGQDSCWIKKRRWIRIMKKVVEISTEDTPMHDQSMSSNSDSSDSDDNHSLDLSRHSVSTFESKTCTSVSTTMTKAQSIFIGCSTLPQPLLQEQISANNTHQIIPVVAEEGQQQQPANSTLLSWESNDQALDCRRCHRWFNFLTRRHHCRKCGQVICDRCSANRAFLPSNQIIQPPNVTPDAENSLQPQRICDTCVDTVVSEISMSTKKRANSIMSECPVCCRRLSNLSTQEQEDHVQVCLSMDSCKINAGGIRYVVYKITPSSTLIGQECVICFEEFASGDTITRLNCMCSYHGHCISTWFAKGKECPIHSQ
ncbi:ankyrin repeat-containing domain protein [Parasitella parasitica]|nr:ankyrin repeat-containing domain protein [Parasitella parasitica]